MTEQLKSLTTQLTPDLWWLSVPFIIALFLLLRLLNQRVKHVILKSLTNPVFLSIAIIALLLVNLNLPYTKFASHSQLLSWLFRARYCGTSITFISAVCSCT